MSFRNHKPISYAFVVAVAGLASLDSAYACSIREGSLVTGAELVAEAEVILLARAMRPGRPSELAGQSPYSLEVNTHLANRAVEFEVEHVYRGNLKKDQITLLGTTEQYFGPNSSRPPYVFGRSADHASCYATDYKIGQRYLLLLKGGTPYWAPLAATTEEVTGDDDNWVMWMRGVLAGLRFQRDEEAHDHAEIGQQE